MKRFWFNILATYRFGEKSLPPIERQYSTMWQFAMMLKGVGVPLVWYPPAETPEQSMLNRAFDEAGATPAALAMAKAEEGDDVSRDISVWNGIEGDGGIVLSDLIGIDEAPSALSLKSREVAVFKDVDTAAAVIASAVGLWNPVRVQCVPPKYQCVFPQRLRVGWMLYLPRVITAQQAPEAMRLIPVLGEKKKQRGTIIVSVDGVFDVANPDHVKRANDLEVRLADQGLLPLTTEF